MMYQVKKQYQYMITPVPLCWYISILLQCEREAYLSPTRSVICIRGAQPTRAARPSMAMYCRLLLLLLLFAAIYYDRCCYRCCPLVFCHCCCCDGATTDTEQTTCEANLFRCTRGGWDCCTLCFHLRLTMRTNWTHAVVHISVYQVLYLYQFLYVYDTRHRYACHALSCTHSISCCRLLRCSVHRCRCSCCFFLIVVYSYVK